MLRFLKSTIFFAVLSLLSISFAHAAGIPGISEPVTFHTIPDYPAPRQTTFVTAESFITDLNKAIFKWTLNGKSYREGVGLKEISFENGAAGSITVISVEISTQDFGTIKNTFSFRPAEVNLFWQTDTYVPPFYQGKALHAFGGTYKVTAIPEFIDATGKRVNPKNLVYTWKKNGEVDSNASGFGRDYYIGTQTSYLRESDDISVEVSSPKESMAGTASTNISPATSDIVLYEDNPLYGILYEKALDRTLQLFSEEMTIRAEPFNISTPASLSIDWYLNGSPLTNFKDEREIIVRSTGVTGRSDISLRLQHLGKLLQGGKAALTILQ